MEASHCSHANMQCRAADTHQACPLPAPALTPLCPCHLFHGSKASDKHPFSTRPLRFLSGAGIRKGLWVTISSCPLHLQQQKGLMMHLHLRPALQQHSLPESRALLQHTPKQKHWHGSARGVSEKAHPTIARHLKTQSPAPAAAPARSLWHPLLQSRIPKSFALLVCLRGFVIRDVRTDKILPVASRMKQSMLRNYKRLQLCQCKPAYALLPSTSKTSSMCCGIGPGWHSSFPPGLMSPLHTEWGLDLALLHKHGLEMFLVLPYIGLLDQNC